MSCDKLIKINNLQSMALFDLNLCIVKLRKWFKLFVCLNLKDKYVWPKDSILAWKNLSIFTCMLWKLIWLMNVFSYKENSQELYILILTVFMGGWNTAGMVNLLAEATKKLLKVKRGGVALMWGTAAKRCMDQSEGIVAVEVCHKQW